MAKGCRGRSVEENPAGSPALEETLTLSQRRIKTTPRQHSHQVGESPQVKMRLVGEAVGTWVSSLAAGRSDPGSTVSAPIRTVPAQLLEPAASTLELAHRDVWAYAK